MHFKQELTAVGSAALDTIETPHGKVEDVLGGSVFFIGAAAGLFAPINIVAVVEEDFPYDEIEFLAERNVNFDGLETAIGDTFRWSGRYHKNMNIRDTLSTELGDAFVRREQIAETHITPRNTEQKFAYFRFQKTR